MIEKLKIKFGILISSVTLLLLFVNRYIIPQDDIYMFENKQFILLMVSLLMICSCFLLFGHYVQVCVLIITSVLTLLLSKEFGLGMIQIFFIVLLSKRYEFLKKKSRCKLCLFSIIYLATLVVSQLLFKIPFTIYINNYVYYLIILIAVMFLKFVEDNKEIKREIDYTYIDPIAAGLTAAEFELLRNLCDYKETNAQLAQRLRKSINTVKVQMKNILNKIGADTRHQVIDLCKNYFIEH